MEGRTIFVVLWLAFLYIVAWAFSLGNLFGIHFWDRKYALDQIRKAPPDSDLYGSTAFSELGLGYYTYRYFVFFPHVIGAIIWWNMYFIQLVPWVRRRYRGFHRWLGRILMVTALIQAITGVSLASMSKSPIIKSVSIVLGISVVYSTYHAWNAAIAKDIAKHKHWVMRLVGYLQTIALQRFWFVFIIASHQMGLHFLFPSLDDVSLEQVNHIIFQMFDTSFVLAILTAYQFTEWYLDAQQGRMESPQASKPVEYVPSRPEEVQPLQLSGSYLS